jgi:hypothetical protein
MRFDEAFREQAIERILHLPRPRAAVRRQPPRGYAGRSVFRERMLAQIRTDRLCSRRNDIVSIARHGASLAPTREAIAAARCVPPRARNEWRDDSVVCVDGA